MGTKYSNMNGIEIDTMRRGNQVPNVISQDLQKPLTTIEIEQALKQIGDMKAPGLDGYSEKFYKVTWNIIKEEMNNVVQEFFVKDSIYKAINCTLVIPKSNAARLVSDFRPISCCTKTYKIICKILTKRLGKLLSSIVHESHATFFPSKHIHDYIVIAYEMVKGYNRRKGMPNYMLQMDMQNAYDTVD